MKLLSSLSLAALMTFTATSSFAKVCDERNLDQIKYHQRIIKNSLKAAEYSEEDLSQYLNQSRKVELASKGLLVSSVGFILVATGMAPTVVGTTVVTTTASEVSILPILGAVAASALGISTIAAPIYTLSENLQYGKIEKKIHAIANGVDTKKTLLHLPNVTSAKFLDSLDKQMDEFQRQKDELVFAFADLEKELAEKDSHSILDFGGGDRRPIEINYLKALTLKNLYQKMNSELDDSYKLFVGCSF